MAVQRRQPPWQKELEVCQVDVAVEKKTMGAEGEKKTKANAPARSARRSPRRWFGPLLTSVLIIAYFLYTTSDHEASTPLLRNAEALKDARYAPPPECEFQSSSQFYRSLSFSPCVGRYNLHGAFFIEGCSQYGYLYDTCIAQARVGLAYGGSFHYFINRIISKSFVSLSENALA